MENIKNGEIQDEDGIVVGSHTGFTDYTIGQRKGLKLSFPEPRYVKKINPITNTITIAKKRSMFSSKCMTNNINWMIPPPKIPIKAYSKIRYNSKGGNSLIEKHKVINKNYTEGKDFYSVTASHNGYE